MKKLVFVFAMALGVVSFAQTKEEIKAQLAAKKDSIGKLQGEANALQAKLDTYPGWKTGAFGTIGANLQGFNNWFSNGAPNAKTGNIVVTGNAFANLDRDKYFWRNSGNVNLAWLKNDADPSTDVDNDFAGTSDVFTASSLFGYKLTDKWAVSALGEYRTSVIKNFNNPGFLDLGVGATWTPLSNLVVVIHPLNYNFVFAKNDNVYQSSAGAKIMADYTGKLGPINFKSNLSAFQSYKSSNLSNWTWVNSFGYTLWKGIGLGFEFGLRGNKQETLGNATSIYEAGGSVGTKPTFDNTNNKIQSYWLFGLNYSL